MATKVETIRLRSMTNVEMYGYCKDVEQQLVDSIRQLSDAMRAFIDARKAFEVALKPSEAAVSGEDLSRADALVDEAWSDAKAYFKAMLKHPSVECATAAENIYKVFEQYGNPTDLPYSVQYGTMERLLGDLSQIDEATIERAAGKVWIEAISARCDAFNERYALRVQEKSIQKCGVTKEARNALDSAYRLVVEQLNANLILAPTPEIEDFVARLNALITARRMAFKAKKTRATNASSAEATSNEQNLDLSDPS